jgi:pilus assembly protein CpaE
MKSNAFNGNSTGSRNGSAHERRPSPRTLRGLLIAPNRRLARDFQKAVAAGGLLEIVSEVTEFPGPEELDIGLAHFQPDVVLLDISKSPVRAEEQLRDIRERLPQCEVVVLNSSNATEMVVGMLRAGAADYLYTPFEDGSVGESLSRLVKRLRTEEAAQRPRGRVLAYSSAKPGSGASTLASQTAFALKRITGERVLLVDFDMAGGTTNAWLDLRERKSSLPKLLSQSDRWADPSAWAESTVVLHGVELLASPDEPSFERPSTERIHEFLNAAREFYDWVVLDLPATAHADSSVILALADHSFIVTTTELASLHMAHRQLQYLDQVGVPPHKLRLLLNRVRGEEPLPPEELEKSFKARVEACFPNDYFSIHAAGSAGHPLLGEGKLARAVRSLAVRLAEGTDEFHADPGVVAGVLAVQSAC